MGVLNWGWRDLVLALARCLDIKQMLELYPSCQSKGVSLKCHVWKQPLNKIYRAVGKSF